MVLGSRRLRGWSLLAIFSLILGLGPFYGGEETGTPLVG